MSNNEKLGPSNSWRLGIGIAAIILPCVLLLKGIYGSFLFTFSIPFLWEVSLRGKPLSALGLKPRLIIPAAVAAMLQAIVLAFLGAQILTFFGIKGYALDASKTLEYSFAALKIRFPLQNELGYKLLTMSDSLSGTILYLLFSIFIIGLGEELFWRGFIQKKIAYRFSKGISICLAAILFSLTHCYIFTILPLNTGIIFLAIVVFAAASWGYLFTYFDNIWAAAISHGVTAFLIWKYYFFAA